MAEHLSGPFSDPFSGALSGAAQRGFSLVELSIVLLVVSVLTWAVSGAYGNGNALIERDRATQTAETLRQALRAFALRNARLPCPDPVGTGWESNCAGDSVESGWLPYASLGLEQPDDSLHARYGVYRNATANADLAVAADRTGDLPGSPNYRNTRDLIAGLVNASIAETVPRATYLHLTGNDGTDGPVDCTANVRSTPAFFVVIPLRDREGSGNRFEAPNGAGSICTWSPGTPMSSLRDDVVVAESLASLTGWLGARAP